MYGFCSKCIPLILNNHIINWSRNFKGLTMMSAALASISRWLGLFSRPSFREGRDVYSSLQWLVLQVRGQACLHTYVEPTASSACLLFNIMNSYHQKSDHTNYVPLLSSWPHVGLYASLDIAELLSVNFIICIYI